MGMRVKQNDQHIILTLIQNLFSFALILILRDPKQI